MIRLQKYLAQCGVASRRKSEELIEEGRVKVNGKTVSEQGFQIDPVHDQIRIGKKIIKPVQKGILLFHKPRNVVSTMDDPGRRKSVADYLDPSYVGYFPVGRLDWESSGLMIMTNDGELANCLMHPKYKFNREYEVRLRGVITKKIVKQIEKGIYLEDGRASAIIKFIKENEKDSWVNITVQEGRNRLVRRIFEHVNHQVLRLKRISHGPFHLGRVKSGKMVPLSDKDYLRYRDLVLKEAAKVIK